MRIAARVIGIMMVTMCAAIFPVSIILSIFLGWSGPISILLPLAPFGLVIGILLIVFGFKKNNKKFEKALMSNFKQQNKLVVNDHIVLQANRQNPTVDNIQVFYNNEYICMIKEFETQFPNAYASLLKNLSQMTYSNATQVIQPEAKQEEKDERVLENYIKKIESYNVDITDTEVSTALYETSALLKHLVKLMDQYPKTSTKLTKLQEYYLPIVLDILENYYKVNATQHNDEQLLSIKQRLIQSIVLINEAIENITSSLFEEERLNLSADMSVLESLLKKDGLVEEDVLKAK